MKKNICNSLWDSNDDFNYEHLVTLHEAFDDGTLTCEMIKDAISKGFDPDYQGDMECGSLLDMLVFRNKVELVKSLLDSGEVTIDIPNDQCVGGLPLITAYENMVRYNPSNRNANRNEHCISSYKVHYLRACEIFKMLLEANGNPNAISCDGWDFNSVVHIVFEYKDCETAKLLYKYGANPCLRDADGETAYDKANGDKPFLDYIFGIEETEGIHPKPYIVNRNYFTFDFYDLDDASLDRLESLSNIDVSTIELRKDHAYNHTPLTLE